MKDEEIINQENPYVEELQKIPIDTRIDKIVEIKGLAREVSYMKFVELKRFDDKIEISFLEKAGYYLQLTWKIIKTIYPIIIPLIVIFGWIESLKQKKR